MKRNKFIASLVALAAAPQLVISQAKNKFLRNDKGFKTNAGEGRMHGPIKLKGVNSNILDVKISGSDTDGELAIFEQTSLSQGRGTPLHVHHFQNKVFYVVEGSYYFQVGEDKFSLTTGDSIFLPRKVPHAWTQVSEKRKNDRNASTSRKAGKFFCNHGCI